MSFRRQALSLVALLLLAFCLGAAAAPPTLSADGYGAVKIGMTRKQVIRALGVDITPDSGDFDNCYGSEVIGGNPAVWFMFENGRLTVVETADNSRVRTDTGIHVGSREADVRRVYGAAVRMEPAPYDGLPWRELYVWKSKTRGLRFSIDDHGVVTSIYGGSKSIQYSEGCA